MLCILFIAFTLIVLSQEGHPSYKNHFIKAEMFSSGMVGGGRPGVNCVTQAHLENFTAFSRLTWKNSC